MIYISRATAFVTRTHFGCVSTRRHKHDSNVGFAKRDFTSLILKKILSTRWIRTRSKLTNVVNLSTPLSATPFEQSLRLTEFLWPYARTLAQFMGVELFNGYLIQLTLSKTRLKLKQTILHLSSLASAAQVIRALAPSPTM